uniref:Mucin-5AC-like isoform X3 n=1 Tax=Dermatophagoides pteronyssinus TaxID=6956 RepID=A0A6P6YGH8_DERPT|nr:mucin-5AC-like isoform X3 [Dermatophagoides pteronyssinus]
MDDNLNNNKWRPIQMMKSTLATFRSRHRLSVISNHRSISLSSIWLTIMIIISTNITIQHAIANDNNNTADNTMVISLEDLSTVSDDIEMIHDDSDDPDRASLLRQPIRSLFVAPPTSSKRSSSGDSNIRPVRFINFTQILINRNRRLNLTTTSTISPPHSPSSVTNIRNIRKKYIRLGGGGNLNSHTTVVPRLTTLVKTFPSSAITSTTTINPNTEDMRQGRSNHQFGQKKKKKKTLIKVKVKNGDEQLLFYDHHSTAAKQPSTTTTTSTTSTTQTPTTTTTASYITTTTKELSRKKKQDHHHQSSADDDSTTTVPEEEAEEEPDAVEIGEEVEIDDNSGDQTLIPTTTTTTTQMPTTTLKREDVYETVPITLPPQYDDSRDDGYFKRRRPTTTTTTTSTTSTSTSSPTEIPSMMTLEPMMEQFSPHYHHHHPDVHPDLMADQIPMFHPMMSSSPPYHHHHARPAPIIPFMPPPPQPLQPMSGHPGLMMAGPPPLSSPVPRQCHFRMETICPTMSMARRSQFQCFGDGIIHCDGRVSRMCRLFERQSHLRDQGMMLDAMQSSSSTTTDMPPPMIRYYRPDPNNYFYCNQPLMTDECVGIAECVSDASSAFMADMMAGNSLTEPDDQDDEPDIEYKKASPSKLNYRPKPYGKNSPAKQTELKVNHDQDEDDETVNKPPQYHLPSDKLNSKFDGNITTTVIPTTAIPLTTASKFDEESSSNHIEGGGGHQSSSLRSNQPNDLLPPQPPAATTTVAHHRSPQPLSRVQVGLIGALIALGSLMFVMVAALAYYSFQKSRLIRRDGLPRQWWLW